LTGAVFRRFAIPWDWAARQLFAFCLQRSTPKILSFLSYVD
jgi:hypothetical protein